MTCSLPMPPARSPKQMIRYNYGELGYAFWHLGSDLDC